MNKSELIESLSQKSDLTKVESEKFLNAFVETIVDNIKKGNKVSIPGLGIFERTYRAARNGINPSNKKIISIKAKNVPKFKASKSFKEIVA